MIEVREDIDGPPVEGAAELAELGQARWDVRLE